MRTAAKVLKFSRILHLYLGLFTAPALLFFAFTGAVQTLSLHETTQGSSYVPPKWLTVLGQLHKKQTTDLPNRRPRASVGDGREGVAASGATQQKVPDAGAPKHHWPMKIFFLLVSLGLAVSTSTGIYMAWRYNRRGWAIVLLIAGTVVPLLLLGF